MEPIDELCRPKFDVIEENTFCCVNIVNALTWKIKSAGATLAHPLQRSYGGIA